MGAFIILTIIVLVIIFISSYNKLVGLKEQVINSEKEISIQLDRRGKIFDSLINAVKKAMNYEGTTLKEIIDLRNKIVKLDGIENEEKRKLENELSKMISTGTLSSSINLTMEAYPELKANNNMLQLQEEITTTENKLSYAKQAFNGSIEEYNATKESIPYNFIVNWFPKLDKDFKYWELNEEKIQEEEKRRVEF